MQMAPLVALVRDFNAAGVRYLIVGGLAVFAHGFRRTTQDIDLVFDFAPENVEKSMAILGRHGYRPRAPVSFAQFADPDMRRRWIEETDLIVLSLWNPSQPTNEIDVLVAEPFDIPAAWRQAMWGEIAPGTAAAFVDRERLLAMKRLAGRPQDLVDIAELERLKA